VKPLRLSLAALAIAALLAVGAVVAVAAPGSLGHAASPRGGAAHAVYCPAALKKQLKRTIAAYRKRMVSDRRRYFHAHKMAKQRNAFVRLQNLQMKTLQKKLGRCD
jgi:hypothetical protein